jgi:hypothetical protein
MRKSVVRCLLLCAVCWFVSGSREQSFAETNQIITLNDVNGKGLSIEVTIGEQWSHSFRVLLVKKITTTPQIAIWIEDNEGNFLDTLYVTEKFAKQRWGFGSGQKDDKTFRIESLPYWMHKRQAKGLASPTKNNPLPDAVTGATPDKDFVLRTKAATNLTEIAVLMEVNLSFDENKTYPKNAKPDKPGYNGASGQPAVVYRAKVDLTKPGRYDMSLSGHSNPSGEDGKLYEDLSTLTTAVNILKKAVVVVE